MWVSSIWVQKKIAKKGIQTPCLERDWRPYVLFSSWENLSKN